MQMEIAMEINQTGKFVNHINSNRDIMTVIYEHYQVDVVAGHDLATKKRLSFETNVYDSCILDKSLLISNKNMPLRLFNLPTPDSENYQTSPVASFYDRKPNSEQFLTPLQMAEHQGRVVGGGKKFLSQYKLQKISSIRCKTMDKKYISAVGLIGNQVITGQFDGHLQLVDLNSHQSIASFKPHMDLVTRIKKIPETQHQFVSLARKDNCCYLWDTRNMNGYVKYFQHPLFGNQRTGLEVTQNGMLLYLGGEKGDVRVCSIQGEESQTINLGISKCVNSICQHSNRLYISVGERQFPLDSGCSSPNYLFALSGYPQQLQLPLHLNA